MCGVRGRDGEERRARAEYGEQQGQDHGLDPVGAAPQRVAVGEPGLQEPAQPGAPQGP